MATQVDHYGNTPLIYVIKRWSFDEEKNRGSGGIYAERVKFLLDSLSVKARDIVTNKKNNDGQTVVCFFAMEACPPALNALLDYIEKPADCFRNSTILIGLVCNILHGDPGSDGCKKKEILYKGSVKIMRRLLRLIPQSEIKALIKEVKDDSKMSAWDYVVEYEDYIPEVYDLLKYYLDLSK